MTTSSSTIELTLKKWNPTNILKDRRVIIVGKPGSGKSVAALDIMYYVRDIESGIVISPTDKFTGHWENHVPAISIYDSYDSAAVKDLIEDQEKLFRQTYYNLLQDAKRTGKIVRKSDVNIPPVFIICDDCMAENAMTRDNLVTQIFMNGRHLKIFFLCTAQWMMDMPINKRQLVDYLLVCGEDSPPALRRFYDNFFSNYIPTYDAFMDIVEQTTSDYGILVLDRTNYKSKKIEDHIFWWKATEHAPGSFRIGCDEFWAYSNEEYHEEFSELPIQQKYFKRPNMRGPRIKVHRTG